MVRHSKLVKKVDHRSPKQKGQKTSCFQKIPLQEILGDDDDDQKCNFHLYDALLPRAVAITKALLLRQ